VSASSLSHLLATAASGEHRLTPGEALELLRLLAAAEPRAAYSSRVHSMGPFQSGRRRSGRRWNAASNAGLPDRMAIRNPESAPSRSPRWK